MSVEGLIVHLDSNSEGCEIVKIQTTYLDFISRLKRGSLKGRIKFRIHFNKKYEFSLERGRFNQLQLLDEHPLLLDYVEPIVRVQLISAVADVAKIKEAAQRTAFEVFNKWRSISEYTLMPLDTFLAKSYGVLMEAPRSFAVKLVEDVNREGEILRLGESSPKAAGSKFYPPRVLLLDDHYVIAERFWVQVLE